MSIRTRIIGGTIANAAGIAMSAITQIVSVPIFMTAWGAERYGVWLMLTTIPAYFALSDLGFASAATSDMTMLNARGERDRAVATYQSVWLLTNFTSIGIFLLAVTVTSLAPTTIFWIHEYRSVLLMLVIYSGLVMNARVFLAGLRASENYSLGVWLYDPMTLLETSLVLLVAWRGHDFESCAVVMLFIRSLNLMLLWLITRKRVPWLYLGISKASLVELRRLLGPAIAAMAIPTALAINLQGSVVVAGFFVSASAAATLSSVRTMSRVAVQAVGTINRATMPELSSAGATDRRSALRKIVALNLASVGIILFPVAIVFAVVGRYAVEIWTNGTIKPDSIFVGLISFAMVVHGLWYFASNILLAFNVHTHVARNLVLISSCSMLLTIPAAHSFGLNGVGIVLVVAELVCAMEVIGTALKLRLFSLSDFRHALMLRFWRA